jgi:hypothetical protein
LLTWSIASLDGVEGGAALASRFSDLVVDCHDPDLLGRFWSDVLGYEVSDRSDGPEEFYVELSSPSGSRPRLVFWRNHDEKVVKNRLHLDLNPTDRDQAAEVERVVALGATPADVGQGDDVTWVVLADPEGNEFCILRSRVEPF